MIKHNIVILTGGLGTRLHKHTANLYPKILLSLGNQTMLDKMIEYYKDVDFESLRIVVSSPQHLTMIFKYIKLYHRDFYINNDVAVELYEKLDGSYNTIYSLYAGKGLKNAIFHWSDVLPTDNDIFAPYLAYDFILGLDTEPRHRVGINQEGTHRTDFDATNKKGNIPGYFYIKDFDTLINEPLDLLIKIKHGYQKEIDLVDALFYITLLEGYNWATTHAGFIDVGDSEKYEKYMASESLEYRSFNNLIIEGDIVTKHAITPHGETLIENEFNWYKEIHNTGNEMSIPDLHAHSTPQKIIMSRINGITVNDYMKRGCTTNDIQNIISLFNKSISVLHNAPLDKNKIQNHYSINHTQEYLFTTTDRMFEMNFLMEQEIKTIQLKTKGQRITHHFDDTRGASTTSVIRANEFLMDKYNTEYGKGKWGYIHGDPNTANVMVSTDLEKMYFIDPRGKFGFEQMVGDIHYDWAKFIYGLQGYTRFNLDKAFLLDFDPELKILKLDMSPYQILNIDDILKLVAKVRPDLDSKVLMVLVGLIHIRLGQYIKNNLSKSLATVMYGRYLIETTLPYK